MCAILRKVGFSSVTPTPFSQDLDPNNELRRRYSFYVEAVK